MNKFIKYLFLLTVALCFTQKTFAAYIWNNDLRTLFQNNDAIIYGINIRTFNAKDLNGNGIIEEENGEESGNFLNAIGRLDELASYGINTIQLLPVTPVGKIKALGTAGSLYAASSFSELNPQLKSANSRFDIKEEMRMFVEECHKRKMRVIVDLPCCGAYDLYLKNPELFKKDNNGNPIVPSDWTDVRLLDAGTEQQINMDVYGLYENFLDLMSEVGVDGIRANVATIKPAAFWKKLIDKTRLRNPQFLFIAEASPIDKKISEYTSFTPYNKLLEAGFDGYFGTYSELKNWQSASDLYNNVNSDINTYKKFGGKKAVVGNFTTHDQISPILVNGPLYSKMIIWLNSTLPLNPYYIDGFPTGDEYIYYWANKKAPKTYTDDEYYFTHSGQMDIFNFSRRPQGKFIDVFEEFSLANRVKKIAGDIISKGNFVPLKTGSVNVFAFARSYNSDTLIVIGNLNFKKSIDTVVKVPKINNELSSIPIKLFNIPKIKKGEIETSLNPGEVQVLLFNSFEVK